MPSPRHYSIGPTGIPRGIRDHTAPWHCTLDGCALCEGKPSYGDWWQKVDDRLRAEREALKAEAKRQREAKRALQRRRL